MLIPTLQMCCGYPDVSQVLVHVCWESHSFGLNTFVLLVRCLETSIQEINLAILQ